MKRRIRTGWLALRSIRHRPGLYARSITATAVVVAVAMTPATFARSVTGAILDDLEGQAGGRAVIAQFTGTGSAQALRSDPEVDAVWFETVAARTRRARLDTDVVLYERPPSAMPGLVDGRVPQEPGETAVSKRVAAALSLTVGDELDSDTGRWRVVGIYVAPARPQAAEATTVVDTAALPDRPPDAYFIDRGVLDRFPDELAIQSLAGHFEENPYLSRARRIAAVAAGAGPAVMVLMVVVLLSVVVAWGHGLTREFSGLQAAGMSSHQVARVFRVAAVVILVLGGAAGLGLLVVIFSMFGGPLASMVAQDWLRVRYAWGAGVWFGTMAVIGLVALDATAIWHPQRERSGHRMVTRRSAAAMTALAIGVGSLVWVGTRSGPRSAGVAVVALMGTILTLTALLPGIALGASRLTRGATRRLVQALDPSQASVVLVATVLLGMGSFAAALVHVERTTSATQDPNAIPPRSLVLESVRSTDAAELRSGFRRVTGRDAIELRRPDETTTMIRLVPGGARECVASSATLDEADRRCGGPEGLYLTTVAAEAVGLDTDGKTWLISDRLNDGSGSVTIVSFDPTSGAIRSVGSGSPVSVSPWFGEYSAGALAPPGVLANDPATSMAYVVLPGFADLPPNQQAQVQELIFRHAGYSLVFFKEAEDYGMLALESGIVAIVGVLAIAAFTFWGAAGPRSQPELSSLLTTTRPTRQWGIRIAAIWILPAVLVPVFAGFVGLAAARILTGVPISEATLLVSAFAVTGCLSGLVVGYHTYRLLARPPITP